MTEPLIHVDGLTKRFQETSDAVLSDLVFDIGAGAVTGVVGPDGAGKTTLLRLLTGLLQRDGGDLRVCDLDPQTDGAALHTKLSYMPQKFGLYEDLTVLENLDLYADLREISQSERELRFGELLGFTGLAAFTKRLAGALSGGMKQKLGLACSLIRPPQLLLLDEPSVGVDPISRRELWQLVQGLVADGIGVVWSTAYLDEAALCERVLVLSEGRLLYNGAPEDMTRALTGRTFHLTGIGEVRRSLLADLLVHPDVVDAVMEGESIRLVIAENRVPHTLLPHILPSQISSTPPRFEDAFMDRLGGNRKTRSPFQARRPKTIDADRIVIESDRLTKSFGDFMAVKGISFSIGAGEIYGLIGPNGAGKSTTFKMLCGLLKPTAGSANIAGYDLGRSPSEARGRIGYMAQKFSLYSDLSVAQNLSFFSSVYGQTGPGQRAAITQMIQTFDLHEFLHQNAGAIPLGHKQRLALACAILHDPDVLFLDEPTSGVDPRTRREFWSHINALAENDTTVIVTTHFMEEAEYCDRVGLIYAGQMIAEGSPDSLKACVGDPTGTLEDAFVELVGQSALERVA